MALLHSPFALQYCPGMTGQGLSRAARFAYLLFCNIINTVYFRSDIPQTTSSLRTPVDINSLTDTF